MAALSPPEKEALMTHKSILRVLVPSLLVLGALLCALATAQTAQPDKRRFNNMVIVPEEDRFTPFAITIHAGDRVQWTNMDTDDHTVVSDDFVNTGGPLNINRLLPGTDSNGGQPGTLSLKFGRPGVFVFYCRFHSHLDGSHQPVAPGPDGGIQDGNGNFGTPMMGVVTVLP
jgi:plastocyanin